MKKYVEDRGQHWLLSTLHVKKIYTELMQHILTWEAVQIEKKREKVCGEGGLVKKTFIVENYLRYIGYLSSNYLK